MEHIIATLLRNSEQKDAVIYFGPMGCQTGFYFLFDGAQLTDGEAIRLLQQVLPQVQPSRARCRDAARRSAATTGIWMWRWHGTAAGTMRRSSWTAPRKS